MLLKIEKFLFYALVFLLPLQLRLTLLTFGAEFNEWASVFLYATDILLLAVIFLWAWRFIVGRKLEKFFWDGKFIWYPLAVFLAASGLSLFKAGNFYLGVYGYLKLLAFVAFFFYVSLNFKAAYKIEKFWQVFVLSAAVQSIIALLQFFGQKSLGLKIIAESPIAPDIAGVAKIIVDGRRIVRAYGLVPHPNILAAFLVLAIFGLGYLFAKNYEKIKAVNKIIFGTIFVLLSLALFLTFSRIVMVAGLFFLFGWFVILWFRQYKREAVVTTSIAFVVAIFALLVVFWPYFSARYDLAAVKGSQPLDLRLFYNKVAWQLFENDYLFGVGQGNFIQAMKNAVHLETWKYQPVHNIYLLIATEAGIFGIFAFLFFLYKAGRRALQKMIGDKTDFLSGSLFLAAMALLLVIGLFDHFLWDIQQGQLLFWLFLGIMVNYAISPYSSTDRARPSEG